MPPLQIVNISMSDAAIYLVVSDLEIMWKGLAAASVSLKRCVRVGSIRENS